MPNPIRLPGKLCKTCTAGRPWLLFGCLAVPGSSALWLVVCLAAGFLPAYADTRSLRPLNLREEPVRPDAHISVDVNLVMLPVTVTDGKGRVVTDLRRDHFHVFEGREQQQIQYFEQVEAPLSVGLVFDVSGSMRRRIGTAQDALSSLFKYSSPEDEAFLLTFSSTTALRHDFTHELDQLRYGLLLEKLGGQTALVDALFEGLREMRHARHKSKAIVLISDAGGNTNARSKKELLREAVEGDTRVYPVIVDFDVRNREQRLGRAFLEKLAQRTGGRTFMVKRNQEMARTMERLGRLLHSHYVIGYYPLREAPEGKWQRVRVRLEGDPSRAKLRAYAPGGYYRPSGKQ